MYYVSYKINMNMYYRRLSCQQKIQMLTVWFCCYYKSSLLSSSSWSLQESSPAIMISPMSAFRGRRSSLGREEVSDDPRVSRSSSDLDGGTGVEEATGANITSHINYDRADLCIPFFSSCTTPMVLLHEGATFTSGWLGLLFK